MSCPFVMAVPVAWAPEQAALPAPVADPPGSLAERRRPARRARRPWSSSYAPIPR